jgi:hypothetical protein
MCHVLALALSTSGPLLRVCTTLLILLPAQSWTSQSALHSDTFFDAALMAATCGVCSACNWVSAAC